MKLRRKCRVRSLAALAVFWLLAQSAILAQVTLKVAPGSAVAGGADSLNISLTSGPGGAPVAVQWTLNYSNSDLTGISLQAGPAATSTGKSLSCAPSAGSVRCIIWGMNTNIIPNGAIATANFIVSRQAAASSALQITESLAASAIGSGIAVTGSGATLTIIHADAVTKLACSPASLVTGTTAACTVTLAAAASTATSVSLGLAANSANVTVPSSVTVPAGATSAAFTLKAGTVNAAATAIVVASLNGSSASFLLSLLPPVPAIHALVCTPATVLTPGTSTCTVTLTQPASSTGANVALKLGTPVAAITMPSSITVAAWSSSASFSVKAAAVSTATTTSVIVSLNGTSKSFSLTLALPFGGG
jgi:hypothetical protein